MRIKIFLITLFSVLALCGCAAKNAEREKDHVPVKCNLKMPLKPAEDNSFEAHKELKMRRDSQRLHGRGAMKALIYLLRAFVLVVFNLELYVVFDNFIRSENLVLLLWSLCIGIAGALFSPTSLYKTFKV